MTCCCMHYQTPHLLLQTGNCIACKWLATVTECGRWPTQYVVNYMQFCCMGVSSLCTGSWTRSKGACCHLPTASSKPLHDIAACGAHISWQSDPADIAHHVVAAPTHSQDRSDKYCKRGKVGESTLSVMGMLKSAVTHAFLAAL